MRKFVNAQGGMAILRQLNNGKFSVRIRDCKGMRIVSEIVDCEADAGPIMAMHGDYWTEKAI